ncbi:MAG: NADH-quinone oxidoreductase subunit C [Candidatus Thermoplasmatota archaeon]|nr:NADH-quinone oxidoreductase subunit C [Candidatus Thermoplasmatota archaeon]
MSEGDKRSSAGVVGIETAPSRVGENPERRVLRALAESFPKTVSEGTQLRPGVMRAKVDRSDLYSVCRTLREDLGFEHLTMISAVDYDDRFEIIYHIASYQSRLLIELISTTPKDDPVVDSVSSIWGGANWQERESYDLMGIEFKSHPKLERILLPKDVLYHPLRKDFRG